MTVRVRCASGLIFGHVWKILTILKFSGSRRSPPYELKITNGMFYQTGLRDGISSEKMNPETFDVLSNDFIGDMANIKALDFAQDASDATDGRNRLIAIF